MDINKIGKYGFHYNCGMMEVSLGCCISQHISSPEDIIKLFNEIGPGAAMLLSDNRRTLEIHESLTKVGDFSELGTNKNSNRKIYSWIISRNSIKRYEERVKEEKAKAREQVKKLSTSDKKSTSKPRSVKKRTTTNAVSKHNTTRVGHSTRRRNLTRG